MPRKSDLQKSLEKSKEISTEIIADPNHVSKGFYAYPSSVGSKNIIKHAMRCYSEAIYMLKELIKQFETLKSSVVQLPGAEMVMKKQIQNLQYNVKSLEQEKDIVSMLLNK